MADRKISDLTALTTPAAGDFLPIVDISEAAAADKNKRITIEELMRGAPDGTAAAPSIAFETDPNTGIYSPGADQLAISTNGTERVEFGTSEVVFNDGGANYDFRIEGDTDTNLFFVDASTNRVGIGSTLAGNANNRLLVRSDSASAISNVLLLSNGPADNNAGQGVRINLSGVSEANSNIRYAYIESATATSGNDHYIAFGTNAAAATPVERARLTSDGKLLVGTSTSYTLGGGDRRLQVHGANASEAAIGVTRWSADSAAPRLLFGKARGSLGAFTAVIDGDNLGAIEFLGANGTDLSNVGASIAAFVDGNPFTSGDTTDLPSRLVFSTTADGADSPTERLRITSAGVLQIADAGNITVGTTTGTKIGTATTQKLGFYNATPVVQPAAVADATTAVDVITQLNDLLAKLRTLGIIAT